MEWYWAVITIGGTTASVGSILLFIFNGTKKLIREIHSNTEQLGKMMQQMSQMMQQNHNEMKAMMQQNHKDTIMLLNKIVDLIDARVPAKRVNKKYH